MSLINIPGNLTFIVFSTSSSVEITTVYQCMSLINWLYSAHWFTNVIVKLSLQNLYTWLIQHPSTSLSSAILMGIGQLMLSSKDFTENNAGRPLHGKKKNPLHRKQTALKCTSSIPCPCSLLMSLTELVSGSIHSRMFSSLLGNVSIADEMWLISRTQEFCYTCCLEIPFLPLPTHLPEPHWVREA